MVNQSLVNLITTLKTHRPYVEGDEVSLRIREAQQQLLLSNPPTLIARGQRLEPNIDAHSGALFYIVSGTLVFATPYWEGENGICIDVNGETFTLPIPEEVITLDVWYTKVVEEFINSY